MSGIPRLGTWARCVEMRSKGERRIYVSDFSAMNMLSKLMTTLGARFGPRDAARKERTEVSSVELAQTLVNELVRKVSVDTAGAAKDFLIDATHAPGFEDKMRLYQLAVLLTAILNEERVTSQYVAVRKSIEDSFFSTSSDPNELLLRQVQFAMRDLGGLFGQKKEMSWALKWLAETGIHETNPAKLTLFASHWLDYYEAASKSLQQLKPV